MTYPGPNTYPGASTYPGGATGGVTRNLSPNPALQVNALGWFGPSGWARITTAHASLPRTTAFAGSVVGNVSTPRVGVTVGAQYYASVSIRATAAQAGSISVDWYGASGFIVGTPAVPFTTAAGTTVRPELGPVTAPAGATQGLLAITGLDGAAEVTAVRFSLRPGDYFDGASTAPRANWEGAPGSSISNLLLAGDGWSFGETGTRTATAVGPSGLDTVAWTEIAAVVGQAVAAEEMVWSEYALVASVGYDPVRGRIRVDVGRFLPDAIRVEVWSRPVTSARFTLVRGGRIPLIGGEMARHGDDYEFVAGVEMVYRVVGLANPEYSPDIVVQAAEVRITAGLAEAWVKFVAAPYLNRRVQLTGWSAVARASRNARYDITGRTPPVVVTDLHSSRTVTIEVRTATVAETDDLDVALSRGLPIFLHTPVTLALPTLYAVVGDYTYRRESTRSTRSVWSIPLTEVSAPPPSVVGAAVTWATLLDQCATWDEVLDTYATWDEVAS